MNDPETRYARARANLLMRQREYNEAGSRLIQAEREVRDAMGGTAYATAVAAIKRDHSSAERETAPSLPFLAPKDGVKDDCQ
jgi:hypothetical protein